MTKPAIAALALGCALSTTAAAPAHATVSDPGPGVMCGFSAVDDVTTEGGERTLEVDGGPIVLVGDDGLPGSGTLICTLQVNQPHHTATDGVAVRATGTGVVYLPPTLVHLDLDDGDLIFVCTTYVDADGTTLYWNDSNDYSFPGSWSTSASALCTWPHSDGGEPPDWFGWLNATFCPVWLAVDARLGTPLAATWEDCEPYRPIV